MPSSLWTRLTMPWTHTTAPAAMVVVTVVVMAVEVVMVVEVVMAVEVVKRLPAACGGRNECGVCGGRQRSEKATNPPDNRCNRQKHEQLLCWQSERPRPVPVLSQVRRGPRSKHGWRTPPPTSVAHTHTGASTRTYTRCSVVRHCCCC